MTAWSNDQVKETFELIDVYKTDKLEDLERLADNTEGDVHDKALEMLSAYHQFIDACTGFYEDIVYPNTMEELLADEAAATGIEEYPIPF